MYATGSSSAAAFSSAARAISHVAQCVEFFRGGRVESYQPLFQLTSKLASPALLTHAHTEPSACPATVSSREAHTASEAGSAGALAADESAEAPEAGSAGALVADETTEPPEAVLIDEVDPFWAPALSNEALRLLLAIVSGHEQVRGLLCDRVSACFLCITERLHCWCCCLDCLPGIESVDAMMHACLLYVQ